MVKVDLYEHYETVLDNGCDRNCAMCDLFLGSREECVIEANRKWEKWAERRHEQFGEVLDGR